MNIQELKTHLKSPNFITEIRILGLPAVILLLTKDHIWLNFAAAMLFIALILTDLVDGFLARSRNQVSKMGILLDPLADKLLVMAVMVMLIPMERIPAWLVVILIGREFAVTGLRAVAASQGIILAAESLGKQKTVVINVGSVGLILGPSFPLFGINWAVVGFMIVMVGAILSLWSGWEYFASYFKQTK